MTSLTCECECERHSELNDNDFLGMPTHISFAFTCVHSRFDTRELKLSGMNADADEKCKIAYERGKNNQNDDK